MQKTILLFIMIIFGQTFSFAQLEAIHSDSIKTYHLSDVVITATKTETPAMEIASSITILDEKDLINSNKIYLSDVLKDVPGVTVTQQGGPGKITSVFIRGANPRHTLVLIDGMEVNDPGSVSNSFDFGNLQTNNIKRVEILRGPQSTLYGSDAMAGVISIFTKQGTGKPDISLSGEGGSYNTYKGNIGINGSNGLLNYSLNYSAINSGGFSAADKKYGNNEKDSYRNNALFSRIGMTPIENINFDFIFNFSKSKAGLDQNEKFGDDPNFYANIEELFFKTNCTLNLFDGFWTQKFAIGFIRNINKTTDGIDSLHPFLSSENYFTGNRTKFEWQNNFRISNNNTLIFGVETEQDKAFSSYTGTSEFGPYSSEFPSNKSASTGLYLQDQFNYSGTFFSSIGARYDNHNRFGSVITYRIAPAYFIPLTNTKLKATFGTAFKSPSLYYLYEPTYGNSNLKPEKSKGWDAGIEQYLFNYNLTLMATYFRNDFNDLIGFDKDFKTINIDKAETKGMELILSAVPFEKLILSASYTYTDSKNKSMGNEDSGKELLRIPKNKFTVNLNYNLFNTDLNVDVINVGARDDKDFSSIPAKRIELNSYTVVNLAISHKITNQIKLTGRIENLFNTAFQEILYYGTPGLSAYGGIKIDF